MESMSSKLYDKLILAHPKVWLMLIALLMGVSGLYVKNFRLDASADSLVLENDGDLRYHRATSKTYGSEDFLVITYTPFNDLLSKDSLDGLRGLKEDLSKLKRIQSVVSILDVPLLNSPRVNISDLASNPRTLETAGLDKKLAKKEFIKKYWKGSGSFSLLHERHELVNTFTEIPTARSKLEKLSIEITN